MRSRQRLQEALHRLLPTAALGEIGVAELCREAGVHRTTFYGHYATVGDLAADVYAEMIDQVSAVDADSDLTAQGVVRVYHETMVAILVRVMRERDAIRALFESSVSIGFRRRLREYYVGRVSVAIDTLRRANLAAPAHAEVAAAFIAGGLVSAIESWALSEETDADSFARAILENMPVWWPEHSL